MKSSTNIYRYLFYLGLATMTLLLPGCAPPGPMVPLIGPAGENFLLVILLIIAVYVFIWKKDKRS